jgi:hypothetical protein
MKKAFLISAEEARAMKSLGGFEHVSTIVDGILARRGLHRGMFTRPERDQICGRPRKRNIVFRFDAGKSLRANIDDLIQQADELEAPGGGTNYVGAMLQHLVGAKLVEGVRP